MSDATSISEIIQSSLIWIECKNIKQSFLNYIHCQLIILVIWPKKLHVFSIFLSRNSYVRALQVYRICPGSQGCRLGNLFSLRALQFNLPKGFLLSLLWMFIFIVSLTSLMDKFWINFHEIGPPSIITPVTSYHIFHLYFQNLIARQWDFSSRNCGYFN